MAAINQEVIDALLHKTTTKQFIVKNTLSHFESSKLTLLDISKQISTKLGEAENHVEIQYKDNGKYETQIKFGGDLLIVNMHSNIFTFDENHPVQKLKYVQENEMRAYCGMIEIYNFLADSITYSRVNDVGYLMARIFINAENHFFSEGKGQFGFLYRDFETQIFNQEIMATMIQTAMLYSIQFDLWAPAMKEVEELTVLEKIQQNGMTAHKTAKRLGFSLRHANNDI